MTFLNPLFLLGTALAAVPILIHLWFRKRLKRVSFSAVQFLKSTEARRFGWLKLREWLILLTRCLFILFLFMSLARPHLKGSLLGMGRLASVFLIADNSYSMAYGDNLERMKDGCRQIISCYSPNSEFCVVDLGEEQTESESFWMTSKSALHALGKIDIAYTGGSIRRALAKVPQREARYAIDYFYVGDGQAENFRDFPVGVDAPGELFWVPISTGGNVGISNAALKDPVAVALQTYALQVAVHSYTPRLWSGKIGVSSGDYYIEKEYAIQPHMEGRLDFEIPVEFVRGKLELFDDSLLTDNIYYFCKQLPQDMRILIIGDSPYVVRALTAESTTTAAFKVQTAEKLANIDLRRYDVLILAGINEISESERLRILDHTARANTGLAVILGDDIGNRLSEIVSRTCQVIGKTMPKGYVVLDRVDNTHPVFSIYENTGALRDVQCYSYMKVRSAERVVARFSSGDPFLIVRGNTAVITCRMLPQNTNLVYKSSFVPLLLRLLFGLATGSGRKEFYVGESITPFNRIRTPAGEFLDSGDVFTVPGFYSSDSETLCVNVRPEEGDLSILGAERARLLNIRQIDPGRELTGTDLSSFFMVLALLSVVLELGLILLK
jgi:hypothetical protein